MPSFAIANYNSKTNTSAKAENNEGLTTISLKTDKKTKNGKTNTYFTVYVKAIDETITIDWGNGEPEEYTLGSDYEKIRKHFSSSGMHNVIIKGMHIKGIQFNSASKLHSIEFDNATELEEVVIGGEEYLQTIDLSACPMMKTVKCFSSSLSSIAIPESVELLKCSENKLSFRTLPDITPNMNADNYDYSAQKAFTIDESFINGQTVNLSEWTKRKGVTETPQETVFEWYEMIEDDFWGATEEKLDASAYTVKDGVTHFNEVPANQVICKMTSAAFPGLECKSEPITISEDSNVEGYRLGYSYGEPKGSSKAGGKIWYAAGPIFTANELMEFKGDKAVGVRVYMPQAYDNAKVFVRNGVSLNKANLCEKIVNLQKGWNEIYFDAATDLPTDSLLVAYMIKTKNNNDLVNSFDRSIFNDNQTWEMVQDIYESPDENVDFYETPWFNSSNTLPAVPVQVLLSGDKKHFENRLTVNGFYPQFYAPLNGEEKGEIKILLANRGLNKIESISLNYMLDDGSEVAEYVELPVSIEPYEQLTTENYVSFMLPYPDTERHTIKLELVAINGIEDANIYNGKWSQLTQGYHPDNVFPKTPLIETLMSEGDPFSADSEQNLTSLLEQKRWVGHNMVRADYHLSVGDRSDMYELPEFVFDQSVGRLAIYDGEEGYMPEQQTILPSIMIDRDVMTTFAKYRCMGSPFLPIMNNNILGDILLPEALEAPGFAEISVIQKEGETNKGAKFDIYGCISKDIIDRSNLRLSIFLLEDDLMGKQTLFDPFSNEIIEDETFRHAPLVRSYITNPDGEEIVLDENGEFMFTTPEIMLDGMNITKTKVVVFVHKYVEDNKIGNYVLNTTASSIDESLLTSIEEAAKDANIEVDVVDNNIIVKGEYNSLSIFDINGRCVSNSNLNEGVYIVKLVLNDGSIYIKRVIVK